GVFDPAHGSLVEWRIRLDDDLTGQRVDHVLQRNTPENAIRKRLNHLAGFFQLGDSNAVERSAVIVRYHRVLRDIDETAREVPGVGRLQSSVGQTFARTVRRDEVL